mmetsp:Transcript_31292/g.99832  ORF Transcript_31292/g.99832 Transcript_31292/m.99832 type:complete len:378 (-) Transcript_31292:2239-3372(-)
MSALRSPTTVRVGCLNSRTSRRQSSMILKSATMRACSRHICTTLLKPRRQSTWLCEMLLTKASIMVLESTSFTWAPNAGSMTSNIAPRTAGLLRARMMLAACTGVSGSKRRATRSKGLMSSCPTSAPPMMFLSTPTAPCSSIITSRLAAFSLGISAKVRLTIPGSTRSRTAAALATAFLSMARSTRAAKPTLMVSRISAAICGAMAARARATSSGSMPSSMSTTLCVLPCCTICSRRRAALAASCLIISASTAEDDAGSSLASSAAWSLAGRWELSRIAAASAGCIFSSHLAALSWSTCLRMTAAASAFMAPRISPASWSVSTCSIRAPILGSTCSMSSPALLRSREMSITADLSKGICSRMVAPFAGSMYCSILDA